MYGFKKAVTFSYDDGITQDRRLVEIFNRYGMKCTFNLNTGIQSPESFFKIEKVHIERMEQEGLADLYQGHEIALHGLTHAFPNELVKQDNLQAALEEEYLQDAKNIERLYGKYPVGMAYAYGDCPDQVVEYLKTIGIKYGRTVKATHGFEMPKDPMLLESTCHHEDERLFDLAEDFLAAEGSQEHPLLFYVWGHSYEFDVNDNWDRIEKLCQMLSGKEDIFYGTNAQCLFPTE
ncbi:MAG: polysaccharide deacetylase family protein [Lachnospiraceae bacterium]|nr:polysaccharide deacetylase family protein [Lachnospiraceae bacterium]